MAVGEDRRENAEPECPEQGKAKGGFCAVAMLHHFMVNLGRGLHLQHLRLLYPFLSPLR